ncbi:MAG TPA: hypothetical protein VFQ44_01675 [Streptosporangiaceae bacterium]|nr:hypothetical protein [Streptosporangiaceae bacterium]
MARGPEVDHGRLWRKAGEASAFAVGGEYAIAVLAGMFQVPVPVVFLAAFVTCGGLTVASVMTARSAVSRWWAAACSLAGCGWQVYAILAGPWTLRAAAALVIPAVLLTTLWPPIACHHARVALDARRRDDEAVRLADQQFWPVKLAGIGIKGVAYVSRQATLGGHAVVLRLPPSGRVTVRTLAARLEQLEVAARMRHGALRVEAVPDRAYEVVLHVAERDMLAETFPMPADLEPISINDPITIGVQEDGQPCQITLREIATLIVGIRGSGKSNLINVLLAQLARCVDVVVFAIDLKGGRTALPWIQPWLQNPAQCPRPVVDWLATTRDEAERMLRAVIRAIDARAHSGHGGEKIVPTPQMPAIIVLCEEVAVIFGANRTGPVTAARGTTNAEMAALGTQMTQLGRSEAVDPAFVTQRGTVTMTGGGDLKSQCQLRIGLGVASQADARTIIPDDVAVAADLTRMQHPGSGIVHQGRASTITRTKFYRLPHERIAGIARACGWIKPGLDKLTADAMGDDYANRWSTERCGHLPGFGAVTAAASQIPAPGDQTDRQFASIMSTLTDLDDGSANPARRRMVQVVTASGITGIGPSVLTSRLAAEGYTIGRSTLHRWLAEEEAAGVIRRASYGRYKGGAPS